MVRWFCSDHHLGHENIIKYQDRPFDNVHIMDKMLLELHNTYVKPEDHVYFLGDVTMRRGGRVQQDDFIREMKRWNGHKRLFLGNHDHFPAKTYLEAGFEKIYATWRDEQGILYSHMPVHPTSIGSARANVHGHIHGNPSSPPAVFTDKDGKVWVKPYINVSVEVTNYRPINFDELMARIEKAKREYEE